MDWISFDRWDECRQLERPGYTFEIVNAEGQVAWSGCEVPLRVPEGWTSPPAKFRIILAAPAKHSDPIPPPVMR